MKEKEKRKKDRIMEESFILKGKRPLVTTDDPKDRIQCSCTDSPLLIIQPTRIKARPDLLCYCQKAYSLIRQILS